MTGLGRLVSIVSFVVAFGLLFLLASAVSGHLGPVEFIVVLVLAIPVGVARGVLGAPSNHT